VRLQEFGIEMPPQHFSAVKSQQKKRDGKPAGRPGRKPKGEGNLAPTRAPKIVPTGEGDLLDALMSMKPLIAQYGAERVKQMVDLLG
jgi:hypothetical protein